MNSSTDTEAPSLICPPNQTTETDFSKPTAVMVWTDPEATDNSELTPTVTCNAENGSRFEIGETEVLCQAVDQAGNLAICLFTVDVKGTSMDITMVGILYSIHITIISFCFISSLYCQKLGQAVIGVGKT